MALFRPCRVSKVVASPDTLTCGVGIYLTPQSPHPISERWHFLDDLPQRHLSAARLPAVSSVSPLAPNSPTLSGGVESRRDLAGHVCHGGAGLILMVLIVLPGLESDQDEFVTCCDGDGMSHIATRTLST